MLTAHANPSNDFQLSEGLSPRTEHFFGGDVQFEQLNYFGGDGRRKEWP